MLDLLQKLLIGSTFAEHKQMVAKRKQLIEQAKNNKEQQERLKLQFVVIELSQMAVADSDYPYQYAYQSLKKSAAISAQEIWDQKIRENINTFGHQKWHEMLFDEVKKLNPDLKIRKEWEEFKYTQKYTEQQIALLEEELVSANTTSENIKKWIEAWEEKLRNWEVIESQSDREILAKILDIPVNAEIPLAVLPLKIKKVIDGILNFDVVSEWAKNKKIISGQGYDYEELVTYKKLIDSDSSSSQDDDELLDLKLKVAQQEKTLEKQGKMLEEIQDQLNFLLSLTKK